MNCLNNFVNVLERQIEVGLITIFPRKSQSDTSRFKEQIMKQYGQSFIAFPRGIKFNASSHRGVMFITPRKSIPNVFGL